MPGIAIRPGRSEDAPRLAELMTVELQTRFSHLGRGVVTLLHKQMTTSSHALCRVAEVDGRIAGYAVVLTSGGKFYREFLLRKGLWCGLLALPRLLRWSNVRTIFTALTYFGKGENNDPEAELVSMVVAAQAQGLGVGGALWEAVVSSLRQREITELKIATGSDNDRANRMYQRRGCSLTRREKLYHDAEVNIYRYDLPRGALADS